MRLFPLRQSFLSYFLFSSFSLKLFFLENKMLHTFSFKSSIDQPFLFGSQPGLFPSSSSPSSFPPLDPSLASMAKTISLGAICVTLSRNPLLFRRSALSLSTHTKKPTHHFFSKKTTPFPSFPSSFSNLFSKLSKTPLSKWTPLLRSSLPFLPHSFKRTLPFFFSASPAFFHPAPSPSSTPPSPPTTSPVEGEKKVEAMVQKVWTRARWLNRWGAFFVDSLLFVLWMVTLARPPFLLFSCLLISVRDCLTSNGSVGKKVAGIHLVKSDGQPAPWYLRLARGFSLFLMQLSVVGIAVDGISLLGRGIRVTDSLLGLEVVESAWVIEYNEEKVRVDEEK